MPAHNTQPDPKRRITMMYFSPEGTTEGILEKISSGMGHDRPTKIDLTRLPEREDVRHDTSQTKRTTDYWLIGSSVHSGRVPCLVQKELARLNGQFKPTVAVVVGGSRDRAIALRQMVETLTARNYWVVGAAAFFTESSFPRMFSDLPGRPDNQDLETARTFGERVMAKDNFQTHVALDQIGASSQSLFKLFSIAWSRAAASDACKGCLTCGRVYHAEGNGFEARTEGCSTAKQHCFSCISCRKRYLRSSRIFRASDAVRSFVNNRILKGTPHSRKEPLLLL